MHEFLNQSGLSKAVGQVFNIGFGQETSIRELVATILELLGKDIPIKSEVKQVRPESSEVFRLCADNTRAREVLGWRPQYTLPQGLIETIEWIQSNLESYKADTYSY